MEVEAGSGRPIGAHDGHSTARLSLEELSLSFGGVAAIHDVSLAIGAREILCVLGPSGCGKSTTLRIAAGVERQDRGRVLIDGRAVSDDRVHQPPEARSIGLMFQDFALFPHLTVADNVAFGLRASHRAKERRAVVEQRLGAVGLDGMASRYPHQLSGGEQQRVALARALAPQPQIMLMDEPFSGLDTRLRDEVREETLSALRAAGAGVLMVTHEPDEAMRMADRIALMRAGRVVQIGAPFDLYRHPVDRKAAAFFSDINVLEGVVRGGAVETPIGRIDGVGMADGVAVEVVTRPQHLEIEGVEAAPTSSLPTDALRVQARVVRSRFVGTHSLIELRLDHGLDLWRAIVPQAWLPSPGTVLRLGLRREHCHVFARTGSETAMDRLAAE
ncbi:MAG: ABC transporter ATP-binding protein [Pseudomonadota bacterium]